MTETEVLTQSECRSVFDVALKAARACGAGEVEVSLGAGVSALTRFANNAIHQNVAERRRNLSVRTVKDRRTARAGTNRFDAASIRACVEQAAAAARSQEPDPELLPLAEPAEAPPVDRFHADTAACTPEDRAAAAAEAIAIVQSARQTAAGIFSARQSVEAILNSRGLFEYHSETLSQFSITAMAADSSGWAKASYPDRRLVNPAALARLASGRAALSAKPREAPPGRYTVVLEPSAVQDLLGQVFYDFSATALRDQRSFLTGRFNTRLFGENIDIWDDVYHPLQAGAPFDGEGVPRKRLTLVEKGVPTEVAYCREAAHRDGRQPTGHGFALPNEYGEAPVNIVIGGGGTSVEEMIASTDRGILVTRVWYIREVDPFEKIMTGMTRDGTFLIEDGRIVCGLRNFRFNQSVIEMLSNVEALSPHVRATGEEAFDMVAPAMKVRNFNFTETTRF